METAGWKTQTNDREERGVEGQSFSAKSKEMLFVAARHPNYIRLVALLCVYGLNKAVICHHIFDL